MINKELQSAGKVANLIMRPSIRGLRFMHWMTGLSKVKEMDGAESRTVMIDRAAGDGQFRAFVHAPKEMTEPMPTVLYLHGGGYALGHPDQRQYVELMQGLMDVRDCVFVAPEYRVALTDPYPAGVNDCYDCLLWVKDNIAELGGSAEQIFVMGDSAGGGLTVAVCLLARDRNSVEIAFQMPLYPMLDDRQVTKSAVNNTMPVWNSKHNKVGWELYLRGLLEKDEPIPAYAAPSRETDFSNLPPMGTFVGELDPFFDETREYVARLKSADIAVHFESFAGAFHGFEVLAPKADVSQRAIKFMQKTFAFAVDNYFSG